MRIVCAFLVLGVSFFALAADPNTAGRPLEAFRAHDPFILADEPSRTYYLYTSVTSGALPRSQAGVVAYTSKDLELWQGPKVVFRVPEGGWANPAHGAWAPEVHPHQGKYYLFVTLHNRDTVFTEPPTTPRVTHARGTQIFVSDSPDGPFMPIADRPATPREMMTLDGTLWVEDGVPWIVYCHEWIQVTDGTFEAMRLRPDFSAAEGEPRLLFRASEAPWIDKAARKSDQHYVSDGCFFWRTKTGRLLMLWSTWQGNGRYCELIARSKSDTLAGPWEQAGALLTDDSGHGMVFRTFDGRLMLVVHRPTMSPDSRARLHELRDMGDTLEIVNSKH